MNNRISQYLPDSVPDFDVPPFSDRQRAICAFCFCLIISLFVLAAGVISTVRFALGGLPLSGNAGRVSGIPVVTVIAAFTTLTCAAIASITVPIIWKRGIQKVRTTPADPPEEGVAPETDADRLWRVYAAGKFVEFALAESAAILTCVLFHLTADWLMMAFVAAMIAMMLVKFPTVAKAKQWFQTVGDSE